MRYFNLIASAMCVFYVLSSFADDDILTQEVFDLYTIQENSNETVIMDLARPVTLGQKSGLPESTYSFDISIDPVGESFDDITNDAFLALKTGHFEAADLLYRKALKFDSENSDLLFALGYVNQKLENYQIAKQFYREVLQQDQYYVKAFKNFFSILSLEDSELAIKKLTEMAQLNPYHPIIISQLSDAYYKAGNIQLSLKYILKALKIEPYNEGYNCEVGRLYEELKDYETARYYYNEALKYTGPEPECDPAVLKQKILHLSQQS